MASLKLHTRRNTAWDADRSANPVHWKAEQGAGPLQDLFDAFGQEIAALTGSPSATWHKSPAIQALLEAARPRGWRDPGTTYLPYMSEGKQAKAFADLRKKTGIGVSRNPDARRPPGRLLQT